MKPIARGSLRTIAALGVALALAFTFSISTMARAAPGDLDPTFSGDGKQTSNFGPGSSGASAIVRQPDGKIVAVGAHSSLFPSRYAFALTRYNPNGSLDSSFSGDGMQTTDFGGGAVANGVALQPNGKIVAVGDVELGGHSAFALARYNPDGSLDPGFSGDGRRMSNFRGGGANGVALQANGKIVAVGSGLGTDLSSDFVVARYLGG